MTQWKNVPVKPDTYQALIELGKKRDTFDDIIKRLIRNVSTDKVNEHD